MAFSLKSLKGCRFHLSQSWRRKIQYLELSKELKNKDSEVGRTLKLFFGLSFLLPEEFINFFTDDLMSLKPANEKLDEFFEFLIENYIGRNSTFPSIIRAE